MKIRNLLKKIVGIGEFGTLNLNNRKLWLKNVLENLPKGSKILDAGAGEQQYKKFCSNLNYVSQDFCQYEGIGNEKGLHTGVWKTDEIDIVSDITKIPEEDSKFDAVLCTEVLEHVPDPMSALKEFHRLLKPGGELIITAPFMSWTHYAPYHFCTGFNKYFYEHHLSEIGFSNIEISPNGDYSELMGQELRRIQTFYGKTPFYIKLCILALLKFIKVNSKNKNLTDLACIGFHVRAKKK